MNRIRELRQVAGMTQAELAQRLDIDRSTVAQWERGFSAPRTKMLLPLCRALACGVEELIGEEEADG